MSCQKELRGWIWILQVWNLLDDIDSANLLNGYFRLFMPDLSELDRATYVLYNIKSEKS